MRIAATPFTRWANRAAALLIVGLILAATPSIVSYWYRVHECERKEAQIRALIAPLLARCPDAFLIRSTVPNVAVVGSVPEESDVQAFTTALTPAFGPEEATRLTQGLRVRPTTQP